MSKPRNRSCLSGDVKICEATPEGPRDPSLERCGRRPLRAAPLRRCRARPRCRRIARAHHHCARSPADGSGGASQVWSCAALAVIFIGERKPLCSARAPQGLLRQSIIRCATSRDSKLHRLTRLPLISWLRGYSHNPAPLEHLLFCCGPRGRGKGGWSMCEPSVARPPDLRLA